MKLGGKPFFCFSMFGFLCAEGQVYCGRGPGTSTLAWPGLAYVASPGVALP